MAARPLQELVLVLGAVQVELDEHAEGPGDFGPDEVIAVHGAAVRVDNARYLLRAVLANDLRPCDRCGHSKVRTGRS